MLQQRNRKALLIDFCLPPLQHHYSVHAVAASESWALRDRCQRSRQTSRPLSLSLSLSLPGPHSTSARGWRIDWREGKREEKEGGT